MNQDVTVRFPGGLRVDAELGGKTIRTDQPVAHGGGGTAPDPTEHFLASIATCAGFYALQFCRTRSIDAGRLAMRMRTTYDPEAKLHARIRLEVDLPPDFPPKYERAIVRAMNRCSVKRHLSPAVQIEIAVAYAQHEAS
jgi:ribosomal protein S12 methylthiotransferase accessory factor